jgi:hypothetical protein
VNKPSFFALLLCFLVSATGGAPRHAVAQGYVPNDYEQYQLEVINRARLNPPAEVTRLSALPWAGTPGLNEGPPTTPITVTPKQPLAFNPALIKTARDYTNFLIQTRQFGHELNGTIASRATANGYVFSGSWGYGENIGYIASTLSPFDITRDHAEELYDNLFIDYTPQSGAVPGRGHRENIMDDSWKEIGIGIVAGANYPSVGFNAVFTTMDFAYTTYASANSFVTGVVYNDTDHDGFYSPGEGIGGVTIAAAPVSGGASLTTLTWNSGGYSLRLPQGSYNITAAGTFGAVKMGSITIAAKNIKLDATNPSAQSSSFSNSDFNADGIPDIVLKNGSAIGVWCPDASGNFKQWIGMKADFGSWVPVGVGDFNGDGIPDILLKNGQLLGVWCPDANGSYKQWIGLNTNFGSWVPVGVGGFNGDGIPDILLKNGPYLGVWCPDANGNYKAWIGVNVNLGSWIPVGN